jgi:hypothetical protein
MQSLVFFNNQGDSLNFIWKPGSERWEGSLMFDENGNDTFKTIGLYLFEKIPAFVYQNPDNLKLDKFQLFNEYRFDITGNSYMTQSVTNIELVNLNPEFYSKWIYGEHFESKFPVGTQVYFNSPIFEFTNKNMSYTVVDTKKGAILIISGIDNQTFNSLYGNQMSLTSSYNGINISGLNSIGVYNYVDQSLNNLLSGWSEPDFYSKYFNGRKLTLLNTTNNDGVVTINNVDVFDKIYYKYELGINTFTQSQDLLIELVMKTQLPVVYMGGLSLSGNSVQFSSTVPEILKPGNEFVIPTSILNSNNLVVDSIPSFLGNTNLTYYATQSQVIFNNLIYQCIQSYTWSGTSSIDPTNTSYWSAPTYLPVTTTLSNETLLSAEIHLTTNKIYFYQQFTQSSTVTLASAASKWSSDFNFFNIDLYYKNYKLHADLVYPSLYAQVNFYPGVIGSASYGVNKKIYEQNVGILETLTPEVNTDISSNFNYNIVFTNLDQFGIIITINGQVYQQEIDFIYTGLNVDMVRTIDRTLRYWLVTHYSSLVTLGIIPSLSSINNTLPIYLNTINLKTEYPNVPLNFNVSVGSNTPADFYIEHSEVVFYDMGGFLNININGLSYTQAVVLNSGIPDMTTALNNWIDAHSSVLSEYGIFVSSVNSMLIFRVKSQTQRLEYTIQTGKTTLPGIDQYTIINKKRGNFGSTITSNSITLPTSGTFSFEDYAFATGQVVAVNNTLRPYDNQEYNILYLGQTDLVLSYQGPFWGTTDPRCDVSAFATIAFSGGFGATGCLPVIPPPVIEYGGNFNLLAFTSSFNLHFASTNSYNVTNYSINNTNIVDIIYVQFVNYIYVLGDVVNVVDSILAEPISIINLSNGVDKSLMMKFNPINSYLYCLTTTNIYVIDPILNSIIETIPLSLVPNSMEINIINGDVYVTYSSNSRIDIWSFNSFNTPTKTISTTSGTLDIVFNYSDNSMYITQNDDLVTVIDSSRMVSSTYSVVGLLPQIYYEPVGSSVYVFGTNSLNNINGGILQPISSVSTSVFNDLIFNNIIGDVTISQDISFSIIDLSGSLIHSTIVNNYGYLALSQYDGDIYMASQNSSSVLILDTINGSIKGSVSVTDEISKLIYNPDRKTMFGIDSVQNLLVEIGVVINSSININNPTYSTVGESYYGTLDPYYTQPTDLWLKTREYIRRPRENYADEPYVSYVWSWETDQYPQMFLYDFSGNQLPITGSYAYTGTKPLDLVVLNKYPNTNIDRVSLSEFQQTIFSSITEKLEHVDSSTDLSIIPEPMELFIGFRGDDEGPLTSRLILYKREDINFTITTTSTNNDTIQFKLVRDSVNGDYGMISLDINSTSFFTFDSSNVTRGLKPGQLIKLFISDVTNTKNRYISINHGKILKIRNVYNRSIIVDFVTSVNGFDILIDEMTKISNYPSSVNTTYLGVTFKVIDKQIGLFNVYGQTEIEDIRYKTELSNVGHNITAEDAFIFKSYDINEQGVDWGYLNRKRKEMLMVRHDIFPYVGSYKAIVNAINFFGYNDLELYEYYRNININSPLFYTLFKVEIPDIFDNTVAGFTVNDFIKHTMPNPNYETTNLFNLTYKITDKEGNNLLTYSLNDVILKLEGLKYWLQKNVIPITHRIMDITGRADFVGTDAIVHRSYEVKILNVYQNMTPVDFNLTEAYLMPINSGSTVYTCHIDFVVATSSVLPDYFNLKIRTYKTYKEWNVFNTYMIGDRVIYYGKIYESVIDNNNLNDPRKYDNSPLWNNSTNYMLGQIVNYNQSIYEYIGTQSSFINYGTQSSITPYGDISTNGSAASWLDITIWKNIDIVPVQYITEYRLGTQSYNFTIDSNIDPFVVIEVTSDNGYGQIYTSKKNYEIRGLNDLQSPLRYIDPIGPFVPIIEIN